MFLSLLYRWITCWSSSGLFHSTLAIINTPFRTKCFFIIPYSLGMVWSSFMYVYALCFLLQGLCVQVGSGPICKNLWLVRRTIKFKHKNLFHKDLPFHSLNLLMSLAGEIELYWWLRLQPREIVDKKIYSASLRLLLAMTNLSAGSYSRRG